MEDIRPYSSSEEPERDEQPVENPAEWEAARFETDDEVPFHLPRD